MPTADRLNEIAARIFTECADTLRLQKANPFRVNAYLYAGDTLDNFGRNVADLMQAEGIKGLVALPGIREGIAHTIYEYIATGRMSRLENLRGAADPVELFFNPDLKFPKLRNLTFLAKYSDYQISPVSPKYLNIVNH